VAANETLNALARKRRGGGGIAAATGVKATAKKLSAL